jgi:hypothetical protein
MSRLTLYIPGLLDFTRHNLFEDFTEPVSLATILGHADKSHIDAPGYCPQLARLFGLTLSGEADFPAAAITRLIDDAARPQGVWMRADPVHLSTGAHGMTLFDVTRLQLEQHEALALGAKLQSLFKEHHFHLEVPSADRWYVQLPAIPGIQTVDLAAARGQSILNLMPRGRDRAEWLTFINEIQMQLHDCDINRLREDSGKLPVNSLWFWGSGELPAILPRTWSRVYSDDALVQGLCMLSGTVCEPVEQFIINSLQAQGEYLLVLDAVQRCHDYQDIAGWNTWVERIEKQWMRPILNNVHLGHIRSVKLLTDHEMYHFKKIHLLKFWRGLRKFSDHLRADV